MGRHIRQTASLRGGDAPELTAGGGDPRTSDRNGRAASTPGGPGEAYGRIVSLDGLRGVAALSVVFYYAVEKPSIRLAKQAGALLGR